MANFTRSCYCEYYVLNELEKAICDFVAIGK
jgi:hypothetical protein